MPKLVCVDCQTELSILKSGGYVIETFGNPEHPKPYKIWSADVWECPGCHKKIVAGFSNHPLGEHYEGDFPELLDRVLASPEAKAGYVIYDHEKPRKEAG
jgi:hypothetical protein